MSAPVLYRWDGEAMKPLPRYAKECDREFVIGEVYRLEESHERSAQSHRFYFAALHDAWLNLSDELALEYPTVEHLRKRLLIKAGFAHERHVTCSSQHEARRIAAFMKPLNDYALVDVRGSTVRVFTARSQSVRAMKKAEFERSKNAVLDLAAELVGVPIEELKANAGRAA